jgi:RNA ligase
MPEQILSTSWHSYPRIYALGHAALKELLDGTVVVEEKIDGSQFSFGRFGNELKVRSKGQEISIDHPEGMFQLAVDWVKANQEKLTPGWTYRAEYLSKPKHNTLAYDRAPKNNLIIFDINVGHEEYLAADAKKRIAEQIGLEVVPTIFEGNLDTIEHFTQLLETISVLGGQKIEGLVVKNYAKFGDDKKVLMGKFVSEAFKEVHGNEWKLAHPNRADIVLSLVSKYRTPARWEKAAHHLRESGKLEGSPRDIGLLLKEAQTDLDKECGDEIKQALYVWAKSKILRGSVNGLPEWYKEQLLKTQFEKGGA